MGTTATTVRAARLNRMPHVTLSYRVCLEPLTCSSCALSSTGKLSASNARPTVLMHSNEKDILKVEF